jgi:hypothetical protein
MVQPMLILKIITAAALLQFSALCQASCDGLAEKLSVELRYPDSAASGTPSFSDCKVWSGDPSKTIVALAHFQPGSSFTSPESNMGLYDLDTLIVNTMTGEIISRLFQKGALSSDAIVLDKISIDSARYSLAPNVRAFGIRIHHKHPIRGYPHEFEELNLYVANGKKIRLVLDALATLDSGGEVGECEGNLSDVRRTLAMGKSTNHGYADVIVTTKTIDSESKLINGDCKEVAQKPVFTQDILQFDGERYPHAMH